MTEQQSRAERRELEREYSKPPSRYEVGQYFLQMQQAIGADMAAIMTDINAIYLLLGRLGITQEQIEEARQTAVSAALLKAGGTNETKDHNS